MSCLEMNKSPLVCVNDFVFTLLCILIGQIIYTYLRPYFLILYYLVMLNDAYDTVVTFRRKYLRRYLIWDISAAWYFISCLINLHLNTKNLNSILSMSPIDFQQIIYYDIILYIYIKYYIHKQNIFRMDLFIFSMNIIE